MQIGVIGLERMGANIVQRLTQQGHECVVFNGSAARVQSLENEGAIGTHSLTEFVQLLTKPRIVWLMLPTGEAIDCMVAELLETLGLGDIIIDGGNSYYKDDVQRAKQANRKGIHYIDVGVGGDTRGVEQGYCLMIGGDAQIVSYLDPIFRSLATAKADTGIHYFHCGASGAGHFIKMVHTSIKTVLMQAYAEGFEILRQASAASVADDYRYDFNLAEITAIWCKCRVIGSGLLDHCTIALTEDPDLTQNITTIPGVEEGTWAVTTAIEQAIPAKLLTTALLNQLELRQHDSFATKLVTIMDSQSRA